MGFFFADAKVEPKPSRPTATTNTKRIPIQSLNDLSCSVCPRDKEKIRTPKMTPTGIKSPTIYLLGSGVTEDDDKTGEHFSDRAGLKIVEQFDKRTLERDIRFGHITQCIAPAPGKPDVVDIECCRNRVIKDIEASKPVIVIGVGDLTLNWATGLDRNALLFRGTMIATRFGKHDCWYYPVLYPNFIFKKQQFGKSEYELTLEHDIDNLLDWLDRMSEVAEEANVPIRPTIYDAPYDLGIEYVTGNEPGDLQRLERAFKRLAGAPDISIDIETNGFKPHDIEKPLIISCAIGTFEDTVVFPLDHPEGWGTEGRRKQVWSMLGEFLVNSGKKIAHSLGFEMLWLAWFYGDRVLRLTEWDDTMAMAHTLDEREGTKSLDVQCRIHFGFFLKAQSRVDVSQKNWWLLYSLHDCLRYNAMDCKWTHLLARTLQPELERNPDYHVEHKRKVKLAPTLVMMEEKGLPIDLDYADQLQQRYDRELDDLVTKINRCPEVKEYVQRFGTFSAANSDHVLKLMKDVCQRDEIRIEEKDGSIRWTSGEEALGQMPEREVPSAPLILKHRTVAKMKSTYIDKIVSGETLSLDNRLHSNYNSMKTVSGRLASPMHNWPKHHNPETRGVVATLNKDEWLVAADYGQLQFRIAGMASEDQNIVHYCWTDYDCHMYWAQRMVEEYGPIKDHIADTYQIDWDEKGMKTLRQDAKNMWVFPMIFGSSARSCALSLHLPLDIADKLSREFWDEFYGVKHWQDREMAFYEKNLYVETLTGRRRRGPMTKNELINHKIQGTEADIVLEAMTALSERSQIDDDPCLQCNFNGHDDLTFVIPDRGLERHIDIISEEMCKLRFPFINVPLIVEVSIGMRWNELKKLEVFKSNELYNQERP